MTPWGATFAFLYLMTAALPALAGPRTVVVLLYDGFAPAIVAAHDTPNLDRLATEGAFTHGFTPAFPTVSLINGVTISSGCWPASHGIVANRFLDPERGLYDHSGDADWLTGCEHLHEAAERQGVRSAALEWYGALSSTRGKRATIASKTESWEEMPSDAIMARHVVEVLQLPDEQRPRLVLAYFRGPDNAAHFTGIESEETRAAAVGSDASLGSVVAAIDALPFARDVSLIVTTDHGMLPVTHAVNVTRILGRHEIAARSVSDGSTTYLYFDDPTTIDAAVESLSHYEEFDVYRRGALPDWAHLGSGPRVGDLVLSAHPPYFTADIEQWPWWSQWLGSIGPDFVPATASLKATHGYPPDTPGVAGILYARGSGIAKGTHLEHMRAIDLHPTVTHLLGIEPGRPVDGRVEHGLLAPATGEGTR